MTLTYEQVVDLLPAYSIGALEADEEAAVDEYIRLQRELIKSLSTAENATLLLAQGTEHAPLAPDAKDRMMARIKADSSKFGAGSPDVADGGNSTMSQQNHASNIASYSSDIQGAAPSRTANGASGMQSRRRDRQSSQGGQGQVIRSRSSRRPAQRPQQRRGAVRPARGARPPEIFPPQPKRSFMSGLFNARALTNATMVASLVTLLFMTLLNFQGEAQLRQTTVDLRENKTKLTQIEQQVGNLSQANHNLSSSNVELATQSAQFSEEQSALRADNEQLKVKESELQLEVVELKDENESIAIERASLFEENARLQTQLDAASDRITLVGAATQATVMFGTDEAPGLQGTFFHRDQQGALVVHGLEPLPPEQSYQFWLVSDQGDQVPAGLFIVSADQEPTWANLELPQDLPAYSLVGITIEPSGGSEIPTGPMLLESILEETTTPPPDTLG